MTKRICTIDGCDAPLIARGWCHRHYKRWQTFGAPTGVGEERGPQTKTAAERFWSKVEKTDTCWLWTGADSGDGYGRFRGPDGKAIGAHRFAWLLDGRELIDGLELDHAVCQNPACVRPDHMEQVTHAVNTERSTGPTAVNGRRTHCVNGHPLTGDNLYHAGGGRHCRTCYLASQRRYKAKRKAASQTT